MTAEASTRAACRCARGLAGMRFRVASHGGRLDLTSQPGRGTTIEAQLPQVSNLQPESEAASA